MSIIFLSTTDTEPYAEITEPSITDIELDAVTGTESKHVDDMIYLVVTAGYYNELQLRVENENSSGASLYISPVDIVDNPTHWGKLITLNDIDATVTPYVYRFLRRWIVINNIYITKKLHVSGNLNIYEV